MTEQIFSAAFPNPFFPSSWRHLTRAILCAGFALALGVAAGCNPPAPPVNAPNPPQSVAEVAQPADPPPQRPNILFIYCDDQAYQAMGCYGDTLAKTPNLDAIAAQGMRFDRCLTTNSLCGPARAVMLTGKYSHLNGFYNNINSVFDGSQVTFPKLLQQADYQTAIVGKWHLVSNPTGFNFWEVLPGQGVYYNPAMIRDGAKVKKQGYVTDVITDDAINWLKNGRDQSKPFFLEVGEKAPHRDWEPSLENLTQYDGVNFPEPPTLFDDFAGRGKAEREQHQTIAAALSDEDFKLTPPPDLNPEQRKVWDAYYEPKNQAFRDMHLTGDALLKWKFQRFMHDYMATAKSVDQSVGKLLAYLSQTGLDKNTIVIFSSDQGVFLGEHGWMDKRWIFEQSMRTPLLIRWPGVIAPGTVNTDMVSNLDFAETFLSAAGLTPPAEMQGHSMVPILEGHTPADWRKDFYYHYYEHPGVHNVARQYGVVTDRYKLVFFYEPNMNYWELFDLQKDPLELTSVYNNPDYAAVQADLHQKLDKLRADYKLPAEDPLESRPIYKGPASDAGGELDDVAIDDIDNAAAKNPTQVVATYRKAADTGDPLAMYHMGWLYENGLCTRTDYSQAMSWYRKAADAGNSAAMYRVAHMYQYALGVPKDMDQAVAWYSKAMDAGSADAKKWVQEYRDDWD